MITLIFFLLGSFFLLATVTFAVLFHVLSGQVKTDIADGCLSLYICLIGSAAAISCYYIAISV